MVDLSVTDWIGREETTRACVDAGLAAMMAATVEPRPVVRQAGDVLPLLWHWTAFPVLDPMDALAEDGHPHKGGFLPPVDLPRRMWASGSLEFLKPLHVDEVFTRHSVIRDVVAKEGGTGRMVFVTVEHEIAGREGMAIRERQDIVYLPMPDRFTPPAPRPVPGAPLLDETVPVNEALLFRYSACTFNAHRIHYDLPYAQAVEKYPALVVHGPLQATYLAALAGRWKGRPPDRFSFRGVHPCFHDHDLRLMAEACDGGLTLCTARGDAHQCQTATAIWEDDT